MHIHVGVQNLKTQVHFHEKFDVVEMTRMLHGRYRESTLRELVQRAPDGARFVVSVPMAVTDATWTEPFAGIPAEKLRGFAPGPEQNRVVEMICRAAGLLRSQTVFISTPPTFTPDRKNIEAMRAFVQLPRWKNLRRVWQPQGVWDPAQTIAVAQDLGIVPVQDPLMAPAAGGDFGYFRVRGPLPVRLLSEMHFDRIVESCTRFKRCFVVFCTLKARTDALNFLEFLDSEG